MKPKDALSPIKETFRSIKAYIEFNVFNKSDNNDIYVIDD